MLLTLLSLSGTQIKDLRITTAGTQMDARDPGATPPILTLRGSTAMSNSVVSVIVFLCEYIQVFFLSVYSSQGDQKKEFAKFTASSSCSSPLIWDPHRNVVCGEQRRGGFVHKKPLLLPLRSLTPAVHYSLELFVFPHQCTGAWPYHNGS